MTTQTVKPQSIFPDLPRESPAVDKNGDFSPYWNLGLSQLFQTLQTNYSNEGLRFPQLTSAQMATIAGNYTSFIGSPLPQNASGGTQQNLPDISGASVFNTDTRSPYQFIITYDGSTPPNVSSAQWVQFGMLLTSSGNPNGNVGGALNWFCFDTTNKVIYMCTTAGSANGTPSPQAVWTSI